VVFGVRDPETLAVTVVRRLHRVPGLDLQIASIGAARQHAKSATINMMPFARYDYLVVADSDVRVAPDHLAQVVPALLRLPPSGIVTCP